MNGEENTNSKQENGLPLQASLKVADPDLDKAVGGGTNNAPGPVVIPDVRYDEGEKILYVPQINLSGPLLNIYRRQQQEKIQKAEAAGYTIIFTEK